MGLPGSVHDSCVFSRSGCSQCSAVDLEVVIPIRQTYPCHHQPLNSSNTGTESGDGTVSSGAVSVGTDDSDHSIFL